MSDEKKHKGMATRFCPEHGIEQRPVTFTYDEQLGMPDMSEVVYEDKGSSVGYSRRYSDAYEQTFGKKDDVLN